MPCRCVLLAYLGLPIFDGLPRTIHFEINDWNNRSWGLYDIERRTDRCETAISENGSRKNKCDFKLFHHYLIPYGGGSWHSLYLQPAHAGYSIDDKTRVARGGPCPCSWDTRRQEPDDSTCSQTAEMLLPGGERLGGGRIGGALVERYQRVDGVATNQLSLAPKYGCEVMESVEWRKGTLGIPAAYRRYRVTLYRPGEPDKSAFELHPGYRVETSP